MAKKGLGKGLGAFFGDDLPSEPVSTEKGAGRPASRKSAENRRRKSLRK